MSKKIQVACVDCARHELIKVSIEDLNTLGVLPLISDDSFVGSDENDTTGLNDSSYVYLEGDCDFRILDLAATFYGKELEWDDDALQDKYHETYDHYRDWLDALSVYDVEDVAFNSGIEINDPSDDLVKILEPEDEYDEEEDEEEEEVEDDSTNSTDDTSGSQLCRYNVLTFERICLVSRKVG